MAIALRAKIKISVSFSTHWQRGSCKQEIESTANCGTFKFQIAELKKFRHLRLRRKITSGVFHCVPQWNTPDVIFRAAMRKIWTSKKAVPATDVIGGFNLNEQTWWCSSVFIQPGNHVGCRDRFHEITSAARVGAVPYITQRPGPYAHCLLYSSSIYSAWMELSNCIEYFSLKFTAMSMQPTISDTFYSALLCEYTVSL